MEISLPLSTVLDRVDYSEFEGELGVRRIGGVASLTDAKQGDASFLASSKFLEGLATTQASLVILPKEVAAKPRSGQLFLRADNPSIEIAKLCELIAQQMWDKPEPGIHRLADIHPTAEVDSSACVEAFARVGAGARVGPGCVIGSGCFIGPASLLGQDCWLSANVVVERDTVIGKRVRLHAGVALGSDGFGYEFEEGRHRKLPQVGSVQIGDDVEIGANTAIDRGRFGPTRIGEGSKIDNLVQIGHNVQIGKHCILCAQVGIAGSTAIGDYVVMGGRAGASGHLTIGDAAQLAGMCVAFSDLEGNAKYGGAPAIPLVAYQRIAVLTRRLPDLFKRLKNIESQLLGQ